MPAGEPERFEAQLGRKPWLVTMEVNPPKGTDLTELLEAVERVRDLVDAINVTDGSGAIMRASPLAGYKRPRAYLFLDELPKNATNKVLRHVLRETAVRLVQTNPSA